MSLPLFNTSNLEVDIPAKTQSKDPQSKDPAKTQSKDPAKTQSKTQSKDQHVFWFDNPNVLFQKEYIFEFFPVNSMSYEQKLNAITRTVLLLTILIFIMTKNVRILIISTITLFAIFILYFYRTPPKKEPFDNAGIGYLSQNKIPIPENIFMPPTSNNPFGNVLVTDYDYNPNKQPAPPAFDTTVSQDILTQAKQLVIESNPDQPDIADKLFKDLGDQYIFEQSLRPFNSTSSTTIPNDQGAFADFCYGSMVSCKEGNMFACARNLARHTN